MVMDDRNPYDKHQESDVEKEIDRIDNRGFRKSQEQMNKAFDPLQRDISRRKNGR